MFGRIRSLVLGAAVVALVAGQGLPAQASTTISGKCAGTTFGAAWFPASITVSKGAKVIWKAVSCSPHTVTSRGTNWSKNVTLQAGQTTSKIFGTKGVFKFRCKFHSSVTNGVCSGMCGKVTVT